MPSHLAVFFKTHIRVQARAREQCACAEGVMDGHIFDAGVNQLLNYMKLTSVLIASEAIKQPTRKGIIFPSYTCSFRICSRDGCGNKLLHYPEGKNTNICKTSEGDRQGGEFSRSPLLSHFSFCGSFPLSISSRLHMSKHQF